MESYFQNVFFIVDFNNAALLLD